MRLLKKIAARLESNNRQTGYDGFSIFLHWLRFFLIIGLLLSIPERGAHINVHASFGITALVVFGVSLIWRFRKGFPAPLPHWSRFERITSVLCHQGLLVVGLFIALSGFSWLVFQTRFPVRPFGLPLSGILPHGTWARPAILTHKTLVKFFLALLALHILGALKHLIVDRDRTLLRILRPSASQPSSEKPQ